MMKRLAMTIALAGLSGGAFAADLRGPIVDIPPPPLVPVAGFSWTGGYIGANVGIGTADANYGYNASQGSSSTPGYYTPGYYTPSSPGYYTPGYYTPGSSYSGFSNSGSEHERSGGVLGGVQAGYNYAFGGGFGGFGGFGAAPVIGVEADFDGSGVHTGGTIGDFAAGNITGSPLYVGATTDLKYFGTLRGRFGVAFDRLFVFGTGGFAYGQTQTSITSPQAGIYTTKSNFHTGYAYGGGVEYAVTNNLALRAEYLHIDLNRKNVSSGYDACTCTSYTIAEKPSLDLVRAGLDYKFDFAHAVPGPVIARY